MTSRTAERSPSALTVSARKTERKPSGGGWQNIFAALPFFFLEAPEGFDEKPLPLAFLGLRREKSKCAFGQRRSGQPLIWVPAPAARATIGT